jgi:kynurenine formamidase
MSVLDALATGLAEGGIEIIDLTTPLSERTPVIELSPEFGPAWRFEREVISRDDAACRVWFWHNIRLSEHTGTHFDAPVHWLSGMKLDDVSAVPPGRLVGSAAESDFPSRRPQATTSCCSASTSGRSR